MHTMITCQSTLRRCYITMRHLQLVVGHRTAKEGCVTLPGANHFGCLTLSTYGTIRRTRGRGREAATSRPMTPQRGSDAHPSRTSFPDPVVRHISHACRFYRPHRQSTSSGCQPARFMYCNHVGRSILVLEHLRARIPPGRACEGHCDFKDVNTGNSLPQDSVRCERLSPHPA